MEGCLCLLLPPPLPPALSPRLPEFLLNLCFRRTQAAAKPVRGLLLVLLLGVTEEPFLAAGEGATAAASGVPEETSQ